MSRLRGALKFTAVTQVFNVAGMLLSLIAIPFYLEWLGQERYGLFLTGLSIIGYFMFADMGISWASMILIAQAAARRDNERIAALVRTSYAFASCSAMLVAALASVLAWSVGHVSGIGWISTHSELPGLVIAVGLSAATTLLCSPPYSVWIGLQEGHRAALYQGVGRISGICATLYAANAGATLGWIFASAVLCNTVAAAVAALHCRSRHPWAFAPGPYWNRPLAIQQLRTGGKNFGMQFGGVLAGTAPVLAVSLVAGATYVPLLSVPLTLISMPLGIFGSMHASLQPAFAEAHVRDEHDWIAGTVRRLLLAAAMFSGLMAAGFLLLAQSFVLIWTTGRLDVPVPMLWSALLIAVPATLWSALRFALTGMNRNREAAAAEIAFGLMALAMGFAAVAWAGFEWVGFGIGLAFILTTGWLLPVILRRELHTRQIWYPAPIDVLKVVLATAASFLAGRMATEFGVEWHPWVLISIAIGATTTAYVFLITAFFGRGWWNRWLAARSA